VNILVVCQYYSPEPFKVADLCAEFSRAGHGVTVLTGIPNYPEGKPYEGYGWFRRNNELVGQIRVIRVPLVYRGHTKARLVCNYLTFALFGAMRALGIRQRFDVVFVYQLSPVLMAIPGIVYSKVHRRPMVMYILDLWPDSFITMEGQRDGIASSSLNRIVRWIYSCCARVGVSSRGFIEGVVRQGVPVERIFYIPQYADDPRENREFSLSVARRPRLPDGFVVTFAGNIGYAQGVSVAIDAAVITRREAPHIKWVFVGEGRAREYLIRRVAENGLGDTVFVPGRVSANEANQYLARSDAAVLILGRSPLFSVTVPAKLQTYLSCGKPILGSIDGEGARIIEEAGAGLVGPAGDARALAENAMRLAGASREALEEYSVNARRCFELHFRRKQHVERILSLLG
jgi:glycosyltransferase involved in cell wall biosynthesis